MILGGLDLEANLCFLGKPRDFSKLGPKGVEYSEKALRRSEDPEANRDKIHLSSFSQ